MNRFRNLIGIIAFSLMILALPSIASAQRRNNRNNDDYNRNGRYNQNLNSTIKNLKNRAKNFEKELTANSTAAVMTAATAKTGLTI